MKYLFICASIFVLAGCGSLTKSGVESDVEIDAPSEIAAQSDELSQRQNDELFAPVEDNRINLESGTTTETVLNIEPEQQDNTESENPTDQIQERETSQVDITPKVVDSITKKVSPVTGPAIPEQEMLEILSNQ